MKLVDLSTSIETIKKKKNYLFFQLLIKILLHLNQFIIKKPVFHKHRSRFITIEKNAPRNSNLNSAISRGNE